MVREMVERSKVKIAVNERELKLYLASTMEENEVKEEGWEEFVHKKKNKSRNNRKPGITTEEILGERKNEKSKWEEPEKMADEEMIKKMLGKALEIGVKAVMQNNVYRFADEIRVQEKGGAIGVKMTGDLAKAVMVPWDKQFVEKLARLEIRRKLYTRYIDDQNIVVEELEPGSRYNREEEKIEIVEEMIERDREIPGDQRTFEIVREVGDSLEEMIKLTADYPSNHLTASAILVQRQGD